MAWVGVTGEEPPPPPGRPKLTGYLYRNVWCNSGAWYRGAWVELQIRPNSGFNLCIAIRGTKLLSWRRVTDLNLGAPSVTCLCCTRPSTSGTSPQNYVAWERKGSDANWRRRRRGRGQRWLLQPIISPVPQSPPPSTLGDPSRKHTTSVQRWSTTFGGHVRSGISCLSCWAGRVRMPVPWE